MTSPPARNSILQPGTFTWLVGIEDTCVYPPHGVDAPPLDEHALTGHDRMWKQDLTLARDLGATAIRYGASWPRAHRAPGTFDWTHLDQVLPHAVDHLGLTVIADLVHYGTPTWLPDGFADPGFPAALAEFAAGFAARYRGTVDHITPLNEPLTTASFCGLRGIWPPYRTGLDGWTQVTVNIAQAVAAATHAVRVVNPGATIVHVEAALPVTTGDPALLADADELTRMAYLPTDLALGRVDLAHPMRAWLHRHGADDAALDGLIAHPAHVDVLGVNYYPNLSPRQLVLHDDRVVQLCIDGGAPMLVEVLRHFEARYRLPLAITETSIEGDDTTRSTWLRDAADTAVELAADGLDLRAFTWWPLFDFVDWSYTADGTSVEEFLVAHTDANGNRVISVQPPLGDPAQGITPFLRRMGLAELHALPDGTLDRRQTLAADLFTTLARVAPTERHEHPRGGSHHHVTAGTAATAALEDHDMKRSHPARSKPDVARCEAPWVR